MSREIKRKSLISSVTFTADQVSKGISNCSNTRAFGCDKLSIFHIKNVGPKVIDDLTVLFNVSITLCRIPVIWKSSVVIPSRNQAMTFLYALHIGQSRLSAQQRKLWIEEILLLTFNNHLLPGGDQHGF